MSAEAQPAGLPVAERFASALNAGRLELPYCHQCQSFVWQPRPFCNSCGSREVTWRVLSGQGTLHSYTRLYGAGERSGQVDSVVGYVDLLEGPRVLCRLTGTARPRINASVHLDADAGVHASAENAVVCFVVDAD